MNDNSGEKIKQKRSLKQRFFSSQNIAYIFMLPWIIGLAIFFIYPFFNSIYLSFSKITSLFGYKLAWVGLENYRKLFLEDIEFIPSLIASFRQTLIHVPSIVILSMVLSVLLNSKIKLRGFFRSIYFLPVLLGTGYVMAQLLGQSSAADASDSLSRGLEIPPELFGLFDDRIMGVVRIIFDNITMILWSSGVQIIIFLSGLQSISPSLYESAHVDGATEWEMFWKITMPMLTPVTIMTIIYTVINTFTDISNPVIAYMLRINKDLRLAGMASAMSWIYLLMVFMFILVVMFVSRGKTDGVYLK